MIIIRKAKPGDEIGIVEVIKEGFKRKNWIYTGSNQYPKGKREKIKKTLKSKSPDSYAFVAIDKEKKKIIGSVNISFRKKGRLRHKVDMGWGLLPDYQGKGIGTRLLKESLKFAKQKGFKRAEAEAAVENLASVKIAKKCGFKIEGRKKDGLLLDNGKYVDNYIFGKVLK